ncbi:MAG TPA: universal stress protein [Candidatus Eisenbacteria bacterium]|jgi:nucleotide-binding universal stress UspA family protein|nr:universal stress protein [Candidatus Eisenbacteria bacterium]
MQAATAKTRTKFENILFATDFSHAAAHAVPFIKKIARHFESNLVALHVRPSVVNPMTQPATWPLDVDAAEAFNKERREELLGTFAGISTEVLIEEGDVRSRLENAMHKHNTDLVIIGTRGRTGLAKMLLGSIAEEIFRNVSCPVLTIGPHSDPAKANIREILFATDFASHAPAAAAYAVSLAQEFQARLTLLHVVPEPKPGELVSWSDVRESGKLLLRKLVPPEAETWCKPEYFVELGAPSERILDLANLRDVDLIVLGAQPEKGVPGAATHLPIATAHKVVAHANCPVLTVRSKR